MALVKAAKGTRLLVKMSDGNSPEAFVHYCTINAEREFSLELNTNESVIPDCDDPDAPGWVDREAVSKSGSISGQGMLNTPDYPIFFAVWDAGEPVRCQVVLDVDSADGGSVVEGLFLLTTLAVSGTKGEKMQGSVAWQSTGALTLADNG